MKITFDSSYDTIKQVVYDYELFKSSVTNPSYGMIQEYNRLAMIMQYNHSVMMLLNQPHLIVVIHSHLYSNI